MQDARLAVCLGNYWHEPLLYKYAQMPMKCFPLSVFSLPFFGSQSLTMSAELPKAVDDLVAMAAKTQTLVSASLSTYFAPHIMCIPNRLILQSWTQRNQPQPKQTAM
jgi:hypothetical protein